MFAPLNLTTPHPPAGASLGGGDAEGVSGEWNVDARSTDDIGSFNAAFAEVLSPEPDGNGAAAELLAPDSLQFASGPNLRGPWLSIEEGASTEESIIFDEGSEKRHVVADVDEASAAIQNITRPETRKYLLTDFPRSGARTDIFHTSEAITGISNKADVAPSILSYPNDQPPANSNLAREVEYLRAAPPPVASAAIPGADGNSESLRGVAKSAIEITTAVLTGTDRPKAEQLALARTPDAPTNFVLDASTPSGLSFDTIELAAPAMRGGTLRQLPNAAPLFAATVIRSPDGALQIQMEPDNIGRMHIEFDGQGETARATVSVERLESLDIARRHADVLARELERQGFSSVDLMFRSGGRDEFTKWSSNLKGSLESEAAEFATIESIQFDGQSFDMRV